MLLTMLLLFGCFDLSLRQHPDTTNGSQGGVFLCDNRDSAGNLRP